MDNSMSLALPETVAVDKLPSFDGALRVLRGKLAICNISPFINAKLNLGLKAGKGGNMNMKTIKELVPADKVKALKAEHDQQLKAAQKFLRKAARELTNDPAYRVRGKIWQDAKGNWAMDTQLRKTQASIADAVEELQAQLREAKAEVAKLQPKQVSGKVVA